jgi:DNA topoisomerase-6 subunit A
VPSIVEDHIIQFKKCNAKFILLIEKGAVWRRFSEDRFWETHQCMILHGGGQPPRGVRRLMWRMHNELKLPVYVLVDNDPWGYYIYSVVKQGSINLAFESQRMAIPAARFIGMSSFDMEKFDIPKAVTISLTDQDIRRAKEILNYPWFGRKKGRIYPWRNEINHMLKLGVKLELEALSAKDFSFITETYLPAKLKDKQWLD